MLPFSHDEVVYGKGSMLTKMPGDEWQKFANLRLVYGYMFTHPGAKLLFMGAEFGQGTEWDYSKSLDWYVLEYPNHQGIKEVVKGLNKLYKTEPALYEKAFDAEGFEWIDGGNAADSVLIYSRKGKEPKNDLVVILNMTPTPHQNFRVGVPHEGSWKEIFNTDDKIYWGSGMNNPKAIKTDKNSWHGRKHSVLVTLPPLSVIVLKQDK